MYFQEAAHLKANNGKIPSNVPIVNQQLAAAAAQAFLQSTMFQPPMKSVSTYSLPKYSPIYSRYYDPNSDGFFYEMASVDGWKRRQPTARPPNAMPSKPAPTTSYGAALARGQMPRNFVIDDSSASSSVSDDFVSAQVCQEIEGMEIYGCRFRTHSVPTLDSLWPPTDLSG